MARHNWIREKATSSGYGREDYASPFERICGVYYKTLTLVLFLDWALSLNEDLGVRGLMASIVHNFSFSFVVLIIALCAFNYPFKDQRRQARLCIIAIVVCLKWFLPDLAGATVLFQRNVAQARLDPGEASSYRWEMIESVALLTLAICALIGFARRSWRITEQSNFVYTGKRSKTDR